MICLGCSPVQSLFEQPKTIEQPPQSPKKGYCVQQFCRPSKTWRDKTVQIHTDTEQTLKEFAGSRRIVFQRHQTSMESRHFVGVHNILLIWKRNFVDCVCLFLLAKNSKPNTSEHPRSQTPGTSASVKTPTFFIWFAKEAHLIQVQLFSAKTDPSAADIPGCCCRDRVSRGEGSRLWASGDDAGVRVGGDAAPRRGDGQRAAGARPRQLGRQTGNWAAESENPRGKFNTGMCLDFARRDFVLYRESSTCLCERCVCVCVCVRVCVCVCVCVMSHTGISCLPSKRKTEIVFHLCDENACGLCGFTLPICAAVYFGGKKGASWCAQFSKFLTRKSDQEIQVAFLQSHAPHSLIQEETVKLWQLEVWPYPCSPACALTRRMQFGWFVISTRSQVTSLHCCLASKGRGKYVLHFFLTSVFLLHTVGNHPDEIETVQLWKWTVANEKQRPSARRSGWSGKKEAGTTGAGTKGAGVKSPAGIIYL